MFKESIVESDLKLSSLRAPPHQLQLGSIIETVEAEISPDDVSGAESNTEPTDESNTDMISRGSASAFTPRPQRPGSMTSASALPFHDQSSPIERPSPEFAVEIIKSESENDDREVPDQAPAEGPKTSTQAAKSPARFEDLSNMSSIPSPMETMDPFVPSEIDNSMESPHASEGAQHATDGEEQDEELVKVKEEKITKVTTKKTKKDPPKETPPAKKPRTPRKTAPKQNGEPGSSKSGNGAAAKKGSGSGAKRSNPETFEATAKRLKLEIEQKEELLAQRKQELESRRESREEVGRNVKSI